jgi:hypothetical protein
MANQTPTPTRHPRPPRTQRRSAATRKKAAAPAPGLKREDLLRAIAQLTVAERARLEATEVLRGMGVIGGRGLAVDIGRAIAAVFYEVALPKSGGSELETNEGLRVSVRSLHCTGKGRRSAIGTLPDGCDRLLALRLAADYAPLEAIEVPRQVFEEYEHVGRLSWTRRLAADPRVRLLPGAVL